MTRKINTLILAILFSYTLQGCQTEHISPARPDMGLPQNYSSQIQGITPKNEWWKSIDNEGLSKLINLGLDHNPDLKIYQAKARQAAATIEKTSASLLPSLTWSASAQHQHSQTKTSASIPASSTGKETWSMGVTGSYDPDIWGSLAAAQKSDLISYNAAIEDLNEKASKLCTDIAITYIDIIAARQKLSILHSQIFTNEKLLELQKLRFINGKSSALELSQQKEALASAKAQLPPVKKQEKLLINELNMLLGRFSDTGQIQFAAQFPDPITLPDTDVPARLLEKRPSIRAAQLRLQSADLQVQIARADLLPSLTLSTSALFSSGKLDFLFENWILSLAASITGPIFDGGRRKAEVKRTLSVVEERIQSYKKTVIQAFSEVEDALVTIEEQNRYIHLLEQQLAASRITLEDARVQYINGKSNYLSYLTAWSGIQRIEIQLITEKAALVKEKIELFRALGWSTPDMALSLTPVNH